MKMRLVIFSVLILGTLGAPASQSLSVNEDGTYQFSYETGNEGGNHFRTESKGPDGIVIGKYSYEDPTGGLRVINYRADDGGFLVSEDGEVPKPSASEHPEPTEVAKDENSEKEKQAEANSLSSTENPEEAEEEKPLKLEEPNPDLPPEGFPPGFFSEQFSALRRLPEPAKDEKPTKAEDGKTDETSGAAAKAGHDPKALFSALWQPEAFPPGFFYQHFTGLRRLEEPIKEQESTQVNDETKPSNPKSDTATTTEQTNPGQKVYSSYILPFPSFIPHPWPASSHHHPVYVYSHQQPNAYSYGYYY